VRQRVGLGSGLGFSQEHNRDNKNPKFTFVLGRGELAFIVPLPYCSSFPSLPPLVSPSSLYLNRAPQSPNSTSSACPSSSSFHIMLLPLPSIGQPPLPQYPAHDPTANTCPVCSLPSLREIHGV
jgi:hypothetical protein